MSWLWIKWSKWRPSNPIWWKQEYTTNHKLTNCLARKATTTPGPVKTLPLEFIQGWTKPDPLKIISRSWKNFNFNIKFYFQRERRQALEICPRWPGKFIIVFHLTVCCCFFFLFHSTVCFSFFFFQPTVCFFLLFLSQQYFLFKHPSQTLQARKCSKHVLVLFHKRKKKRNLSILYFIGGLPKAPMCFI